MLDILLTNLSSFFQAICSKTLVIDDLAQHQEEIVITLCRLKMIFSLLHFVIWWSTWLLNWPRNYARRPCPVYMDVFGGVIPRKIKMICT